MSYAAQPAHVTEKSRLERALSLFTDIRSGEGATAVLMLLNIFLLLICYSVIKTVRDAVYYVHFKCNLHRIDDYPNLSGYLRELYQMPGVAETVNMDQIKQHYYRSHESVNPRRLVPKGPILDFDAPHNRG